MNIFFVSFSLLISFYYYNHSPSNEGNNIIEREGIQRININDTLNSKIFYIAEDGSDHNNGTKEFPFATLDRAKLAIKQHIKSPTTIYLREGYYSVNETFQLSDEELGKNAQIIISSYPGERAYIIGGVRVSDFSKLDLQSEDAKNIDPEISKHIMVTDLKKSGITDYGELSPRGFGGPIQPSGLELYFNEEPMTLARWPNEDWTTITDVPEKLNGKGFLYNGNRISNWANAPDIWLHGYWKYDWADFYSKVTKIDTVKNTIITEEPYSGNYPFTKGKRFYALNILEELDSPGEWYLNREKGNLYFWPPSSIDKSNTFISILKEPLIRIKGMSNIVFKNLTFEYTCGAGIEIIGGKNHKVESCILRNMGTVALSIGKLDPNISSHIYSNTLYSGDVGQNNGVLNCEIYNTGEGGIILGGGDRTTLVPGNNYSINNDIYDCSRWVRTYRAGVFMYGVGNVVKNNLIHDLPHTAVFFWGNDHLIEYNEINNVCMETGDAGAVYNGRDWTQRGSIIRYNYFHHLHGVEGQSGFTDVMAVYLDDWSSGATIYGNIFYKAGRTVMIGGGRDNLVENNIIIDGAPAIHVDARGLGWAKYYFDGSNNTLFERLEVVKPTKHPYSTRYPELTTILEDEPVLPKGNKIIRNISAGGKWIELLNEVSDSLVYFKNNNINVDRNMVLNKDGLIDIQYDSDIIPTGFKKIPFEKIGKIK